MYYGRSIHLILLQVDRHWLSIVRKPIHYQIYSVALKNGSKNFPPWEKLPHPRDDRLFPAIHQSMALRELRLHLGNLYNRGPKFSSPT